MPAANNRSGPSTWDKVNRNTQTFFAKTKSTLMPWTEDRPVRRSSGGSRRADRRRQPRSGSGQNIFSSWFDAKPQHKEIGTVNDYLALPRPAPDD